MSPEDFANDDVCEFFLENKIAVEIFYRICNQWRSGPNGIFALDYNVLPMFFDLFGIVKEKQLQMIDDISVMELAALDEIKKR